MDLPLSQVAPCPSAQPGLEGGDALFWESHTSHGLYSSSLCACLQCALFELEVPVVFYKSTPATRRPLDKVAQGQRRGSSTCPGAPAEKEQCRSCF